MAQPDELIIFRFVSTTDEREYIVLVGKDTKPDNHQLPGFAYRGTFRGTVFDLELLPTDVPLMRTDMLVDGV